MIRSNNPSHSIYPLRWRTRLSTKGALHAPSVRDQNRDDQIQFSANCTFWRSDQESVWFQKPSALAPSHPCREFPRLLFNAVSAKISPASGSASQSESSNLLEAPRIYALAQPVSCRLFPVPNGPDKQRALSLLPLSHLDLIRPSDFALGIHQTPVFSHLLA
jgi:hypothetical protein